MDSHLNASGPLIAWIGELGKRKDYNQVFIRKRAFRSGYKKPFIVRAISHNL